MNKYMKMLLLVLIVFAVVGCGNNQSIEDSHTDISQNQTIELEEIPSTDASYWVNKGNENTGYVSVPYNWTEEEYEYEFEGNYSLMLISPERNAMVSLIENNYGYDPKQYDSKEPAEYIVESYVAQYESQGGGHISTEKVEISGYTFYKAIDCYPAGSYADYDYYLYTYVTFTGDRFYTIVIEGEENAIGDIIIKVEESFAGSKK